MATEAVVRKWGSSMGIVLPKEVVKRQGLREHDKVLVEVVKEADLSKIFGSIKRSLSGQQFKDSVRKGWER